MLTSAKRFHLSLDALALSKHLKEELPIFFHTGMKKGPKKHNNSDCPGCLRDKHRVRTTGDILKIVERNYSQHNRRRNCACRPCREDSGAGCNAPYKCLDEAIRFLNDLAEKWDPRVMVNQPNPELSEEQKDCNKDALEEDETLVFDPAITGKKLTDAFRIF
ncbi:hypothetical protein B0H14DRAFT_2411353, partial [Mycena olivaceomarginata]